MKDYKRKNLSVLLLSVLLLAALPGTVFAALVRTAPEGPSLVRLSWAGNPGESVTITWQDSAGTEESGVEYINGDVQALEAARRGNTDRIQSLQADLAEHASTLSDGGTQWSVTLHGLVPGQTYAYEITSREAVPGSPGETVTRHSGIRSFTTPPEQTDSLDFVYFGDVQVNREAEGEFTRWGELAQKAWSLNPELKFGMMGGDIVESGISTEQFDMFFDAASPVFSRIPLMAVSGNHESNFRSGKPELYLDSFALPENGPEGFKEEFYSFDCGPAHILVLNSWVYSGEQRLNEEDYERIRSWIRQDLLSADDGAWKIVVMHHPLYAVHSDRVSDLVRENWGTLLQEGGADLLLCGHQHVYCRSLPLTDGRVDNEHGITQVMGVSGEKLYSSANETNMERTIYGQSNYQIIHINGDSLEIQCFDRDGQELDYAVLSGRRIGAEETPSGRFEDVSEKDWFREAVDYVSGRSWFQGIGEHSFAPQMTMNRAMFVTVLGRMAGIDTGIYDRSVFRDVPAGQWYSAGIAWAVEQGIVNGTGNGLFDPEHSVTREQMAAMLYRWAKARGMDVASDDMVYHSFSDYRQVSVYAEEAMIWATDRGLINGTEKGLEPGSESTRAMVAAMMMKYDQLVRQKA